MEGLHVLSVPLNIFLYTSQGRSRRFTAGVYRGKLGVFMDCKIAASEDVMVWIFCG